jgi:Na+/melibiose symporter-like transporter
MCFPLSGTVGVVIFFVLTVLGANAFTTIFLIPWAMLPDVLDEYLLMFKYRSDALFYTFFGLGTKVILTIYLALTQLVLRYLLKI